MKKISVIAVAALLILSVFAACGTGEEMKNDMTTMMEDFTSALDSLTSEGRGEVTEEETTEELTEEVTDETTEVTTDILEEDVTEYESKAKSILDDITE